MSEKKLVLLPETSADLLEDIIRDWITTLMTVGERVIDISFSELSFSLKTDGNYPLQRDLVLVSRPDNTMPIILSSGVRVFSVLDPNFSADLEAQLTSWADAGLMIQCSAFGDLSFDRKGMTTLDPHRVFVAIAYPQEANGGDVNPDFNDIKTVICQYGYPFAVPTGIVLKWQIDPSDTRISGIGTPENPDQVVVLAQKWGEDIEGRATVPDERMFIVGVYPFTPEEITVGIIDGIIPDKYYNFRLYGASTNSSRFHPQGTDTKICKYTID